jgi:hypothetical protein
MKTESSIGNGKLGVAAIDGVTGKTRPIAQVFPIRSAIGAFAIRPAKPGNADTVTNFEFRTYLFSYLFHSPNDLVTWYEREFRVWKFSIHHVKIRPAHGTCRDPNEQLSFGQSRLLNIAELERLPWLIQNHRVHV